MKITDEEFGTVTARIHKRDLMRIEGMAKRLGVKKSVLVRNLLLAGLEDARLLDAVGLFTLMRKIEQWRESGFEDQREMQTA